MQKEKWTKLFVCFVVIVVARGTPTNAGDGPTISPTVGSAPLTVRLAGTVHPPTSGVYIVRIYWGDGDFYEYGTWWGAPHFVINELHTYELPSQYTVVRTVRWNGEPEPSFVDSSTVITVTGGPPPPPPCVPVIPALSLGWEHFAVGLQDRRWQGRVTSAIDPLVDFLVGATIDFDDGAGIQPLTWVWDLVGGNWVTDWRIYLLDGVHTASVVNIYNKDGCEFDVISTVNFTTSGSPLVPVEETTWGRVKSLYRE